MLDPALPHPPHLLTSFPPLPLFLISSTLLLVSTATSNKAFCFRSSMVKVDLFHDFNAEDLCFLSIFSSWEEMRCVREGKEWWLLCSVLNADIIQMVPGRCAQWNKRTLPSSNNEHSMLDTATNFSLVFYLEDLCGTEIARVMRKNRGRMKVGEVQRVNVNRLWSHRPEDRRKVC